jgi:CheY-like chemotaxis protein
MGKRVYLVTTDLLFRSKLGAVVQGAGGQVTRDEAACDLALIELGGQDATARIRAFVVRGVPVLAFGSHVRADELRSAREAGAVAVPNSGVEDRLRGML